MRTRTEDRPWIPILTSLALATSAAAQVNSYPIEGPALGAHAGASVAALGDVNADGYDDFAIGAPREYVGATRPGRVRIYSGKTRGLLRTLTGLGDGDQYGRSISTAGDVDADGHGDILVGAPFNDYTHTDAGSAYVHSGATGAILYALRGYEAGDRLGFSVAGGGDVDADGHDDFVVGIPGGAICPWGAPCVPDAGYVAVFSGATGLPTYWSNGSADAPMQHGFSVAFAGDTNLDGRDDVLIGAPYARSIDGTLANVGRVFVWEPHSGAVLTWHYGDVAGGLLGWDVSPAGDVNADGRADYAVSAPFRDGLRGRAQIFSGGDGVSLRTIDGGAGTMLGTSIANAGDVNADGRDDLIVGIPLYTVVFAGTYGAVRVYSGSTGATLETFLGPEQDSDFGIDVAGALDVNHDGTPDVIVGADSVDVVAQNAGRTHVILMDDAAGTLYCFGTTSACPCTNASSASENAGCANSLALGGHLTARGNASVANDEVVLEATHVPYSSSLFFQGTTQENGGIGVSFGDGLRCAGGTIVRLGTHLSSLGRSSYPEGAEEPIHVRGSVPAGSSRTYQVWYRNAAPFCTNSTFNLTNAVRIDWRP